MVKDLQELKNEPLPFPGSFPSDLLEKLRVTHNNLFMHAISDWSIFSMFESSDADIQVKSGPLFKPDLTNLAINHLMPLLLMMTVDASTMCEQVTGKRATHETLQVARQASAWVITNRVPVFEGGGA